MNIPNIFSDYVLSAQRAIVPNENAINLNTSEIILTQEKALEDFSTFQYLMDNAYAGRDYWSIHGVSFDDCYSIIKKRINSTPFISAKELAEFFYSAFENKIIDNHLRIATNFPREHCFNKAFSANKLAYFSEVIIEKIECKNIVVKSNVSSVMIGDTLECYDDMLFRTLSPISKEYYYIGKRSWNTIDTISITINGEVLLLPVHKSKASNYTPKDGKYFDYHTVDNIPIVTSSTFHNDYRVPRECGIEYGRRCRSTEKLIWVLAGNGGGSSQYPQHFITALNDYANSATHSAWLKTNITDFNKVDWEKPYTEWIFNLDEEVDFSKGTFSGSLYTIINSKTGSAAENAVGYSKCIKNNVLIGENTCGMGLFGEVQAFVLKNSFIVLGIPSKIFLSESKEGEGYTPDYWVDSADIEGEVIKWLRDTESYMPSSHTKASTTT